MMEHYKKCKSKNPEYRLAQAMRDAREPYQEMRSRLFHARKVVVHGTRQKAKNSTGSMKKKLDDRADRIEAVAYGDVLHGMRDD